MRAREPTKEHAEPAGLEITNTIPATGHNLGYFERKATCITEGWKPHYGCEACRLCYTDETCTVQASAKEYSIPLDPTNHVGGHMLHDKSSHWIHCACGAEIEKEDHIFDQDYRCTVCGYQGSAQEHGPRSGGLNKWMIIAILLLLLLLLLILILLLGKRKKKKEEQQKAAETDEPEAQKGPSAEIPVNDSDGDTADGGKTNPVTEAVTGSEDLGPVIPVSEVPRDDTERNEDTAPEAPDQTAPTEDDLK